MTASCRRKWDHLDGKTKGCLSAYDYHTTHRNLRLSVYLSLCVCVCVCVSLSLSLSLSLCCVGGGSTFQRISCTLNLSLAFWPLKDPSHIPYPHSHSHRLSTTHTRTHALSLSLSRSLALSKRHSPRPEFVGSGDIRRTSRRVTDEVGSLASPSSAPLTFYLL